jgi:hypothetical protein
VAKTEEPTTELLTDVNGTEIGIKLVYPKGDKLNSFLKDSSSTSTNATFSNSTVQYQFVIDLLCKNDIANFKLLENWTGPAGETLPNPYFNETSG